MEDSQSETMADAAQWMVSSAMGYIAPSGANYITGAVPPAQPPDWNTEEYAHVEENRFQSVSTSPLSTFAADVDTASYAKLRSAILSGLPIPPDSVRIEEMLNYFHYDYAQPREDEPFGITVQAAPCPWNKDTRLLLIGLQAKKVDTSSVPAQNLVFLVDVSGSMDEPNKLPLVKRAFLLLLEELKPTDLISVVTYASSDRVVLDGVPADDKTTIMAALDQMEAGGGTAGAAGIQTAYEIAKKHFVAGGNNRILLATDGDLNIGVSDEGSLTRLVDSKRKEGTFLSVLGFGYGNYKDQKLEALADHGNGNYAYIDTIHEARKALVEEMGGTFHTVAKDVKLQVEFNAAKIKGYRLIGYENRVMAAEDFADDARDGGEVGSGHRVTVLYEIVPVESPMNIDDVPTKYQNTVVTGSEEWLTLSIRAKDPEGEDSKLYSYPVDQEAYQEKMSDNLRFAAAIAEFGMLLRDSKWKGSSGYDQVLELLRGTGSLMGDVYKEEFLYLVTQVQRRGN
ncbi:MAG: VWA domain-containing protein [Clostridiales bacterium]|nr:VWA domain-containing protein [Clostridiales bacterium]